MYESNGYAATIADIRVLGAFTGVGISTADVEKANNSETTGTNLSKTVIGTTINLTATSVNTLFGTDTSLLTSLTIVGRDSGARLTIPVKITRNS